jgi:hypothetical protein
MHAGTGKKTHLEGRQARHKTGNCVIRIWRSGNNGKILLSAQECSGVFGGFLLFNSTFALGQIDLI